MNITRLKPKSIVQVKIEPVLSADYKILTKARFWFNWKTEKEKLVYKLVIGETE